MNAPTKREGGIAIITAIVILVILAALGAFIARVFTLANVSSAQDVQGSQALLAARAGIEWQMYLIQHPEDTGGPPYACPGSPTNVNFGGALSAYSVTVTCGPMTSQNEGDRTIRIYPVVANACNLPAAGACPNNTAGNSGPAYVERQVSIVTETCRLPSGAVC